MTRHWSFRDSKDDKMIQNAFAQCMAVEHWSRSFLKNILALYCTLKSSLSPNPQPSSLYNNEDGGSLRAERIQHLKDHEKLTNMLPHKALPVFNMFQFSAPTNMSLAFCLGLGILLQGVTGLFCRIFPSAVRLWEKFKWLQNLHFLQQRQL